SSHVGSRWYRAPEICLLNNQYDQSSDIWSLACSLFEIL
ncbi:MAG: protein kinase domain-containing protein, partial [bacterium]